MNQSDIKSLTPAQIQAALEAGIINTTQAEVLTSDKTSPQEAAIGHEENLRFIRSFSDIFITIGLIILGIGLFVINDNIPKGLITLSLTYGLVEFFGRKKRAHLPTLILTLTFMGLFINTTHKILGSVNIENLFIHAILYLAAISLLYWRIRLPFCIALIALSCLFLVYSAIFSIFPDIATQYAGLLVIIGGAACLNMALRYDIKDPERVLRFSDNAFWLHLIAAPLLVHGLTLSVAWRNNNGSFGFIGNYPPLLAFLTLSAIGLIILFGLAINRRALIVATISYGIFSLGYILNQTNLKTSTQIAATLIITGAAIVLLGVGWHPLRNQLIKILPKWKIFPPAHNSAPSS